MTLQWEAVTVIPWKPRGNERSQCSTVTRRDLSKRVKKELHRMQCHATTLLNMEKLPEKKLTLRNPARSVQT